MSLFNFFKKKKSEDESDQNSLIGQNENVHLDYEVRNKLKDTRFYTNGIKLMNRKASEPIAVFDEYKKKKPDAIRIKVSYFMESSALLTSLKMQYCRGDSLNSLKPELENIFRLYTKSFEESSIYNETLDVLSLGILFNVPKVFFDDFYKEMDREKVEDYIFTYLIHNVVPEIKVSQKSLFPKDKLNKKLIQIIETNSEQEAVDLIDDLFANGWYTKENLEQFYDYHKAVNGTIFAGYYAWSVAAIVKIKGIDDSSFRDSPYYPADLVHWKKE